MYGAIGLKALKIYSAESVRDKITLKLFFSNDYNLLQDVTTEMCRPNDKGVPSLLKILQR